jgi:hypothetical protein
VRERGPGNERCVRDRSGQLRWANEHELEVGTIRGIADFPDSKARRHQAVAHFVAAPESKGGIRDDLDAIAVKSEHVSE